MLSFRRAVLPLALVVLLPACQGWRGRPLPGPSPAPQPVPSPARITLSDHSTLVVWHGNVERDSLIGLIGPRAGERTRFAVPVAQVRRMQGRGLDFLATATLAAVTTVAVVVASLGSVLGGEW